MDYKPKINTKQDMQCCDFPYVTAEGGFWLQACFVQLRFARIKCRNWTASIEIKTHHSRLTRTSSLWLACSSNNKLNIPTFRCRTFSFVTIDVIQLPISICCRIHRNLNYFVLQLYRRKCFFLISGSEPLVVMNLKHIVDNCSNTSTLNFVNPNNWINLSVW